MPKADPFVASFDKKMTKQCKKLPQKGPAGCSPPTRLPAGNWKKYSRKVFAVSRRGQDHRNFTKKREISENISPAVYILHEEA
ncbi:MAG: hypothetical protein SOV54_07155 [Faecalibacterium prausnitzii]|nr:hypothetical protein [Faecalibacterium prausnitzii]